MSDGAAIDWVALEARYAQRPGAVDRLVRIAIESVRDVPGELRTLADAGDLAGSGRAAHGLRGGAQAIQATLVGQLATQVEAACRSADPDAPDQARRLAAAVDLMLEALALRANT